MAVWIKLLIHWWKTLEHSCNVWKYHCGLGPFSCTFFTDHDHTFHFNCKILPLFLTTNVFLCLSHLYFWPQINGVCISPTTNKQPTKKQHPPELRRTKSQGTRKIQKAQSTASMEDTNGGGGSVLFFILYNFILLVYWHPNQLFQICGATYRISINSFICLFDIVTH
jgi:hypothetical protein